MMIIMIGGKARVGKTTVARWFGEYLYNKGYSPVTVSFAELLKKEVAVTGLTKENNPEEYRLACQLLGATKRKIDPDYWVGKFKERLEEIKSQDILNLEISPKNWHEKCVIVDDCRYLNEVGYGRKVGALEVFIAHGSRELFDHKGRWRDHESENMSNQIESGVLDYQDMFHYRLFNNGTEEAFKSKVNELFDDWLEYLQSDDKVLCACIGCVSARNDSPITLNQLDKLLNNKLHSNIEDIFKEDYIDEDDREDA